MSTTMSCTRLILPKVAIFAIACGALLFSASITIAKNGAAKDDDSPPAKPLRLAIVASDAVQQTGLSDLLTVAMTDQADVNLVERDSLDEAIAELELSALFGAKAAGERLRLGQMLRADMLVLLADERGVPVAKSKKPPRRLRLVVADTRYGARLGVTLFDLDRVRPEELSEKIVSRVGQIRRRFSGEIKRVYAVTAFVSKSLSREYDYLQTGYVNLLQESLMATPGTACLELEEAQAIDRELRIDGSEVKDRHVPLFVEGDFSVSQGRNGQDPRIRLSIKVADGEKELLELKRPSDTMEQAITWLRSEATNAICRAADQVHVPIGRERQKALLIERAEYFDRYSMWDQSLGLRQAAYLLDPYDLRLSLDLEMERVRVLAKPITTYGIAQKGEWKDGGKTFEPPAVHAQHLAQWKKLVRLVERTVATKGLNQREAALLVRLVFSSSENIKPTNGPYSKETKELRQKLFRTVFGQFRQLDETINNGMVRLSVHRAAGERVKYSKRDDLSHAEFWNSSIDFAFQCCFNYTLDYRKTRKSVVVDHRYSLSNVLFLLNEAVPEGEPQPKVSALILDEGWRFSLVRKVRQNQLSRAEVLKFFDALDETGTKENRYYAKVGRFNFALCYGENGERDYSQEMIERFNELIKYSKVNGYGGPDGDSGFVEIMSDMLRIHHLFKERRDRELAQAEPAGADKTLTKKRHTGAQWTRFSDRYDVAPRVGFEMIEEIPAGWQHYFQAGPSLDVAWTKETVYILPAKGKMRKVFGGVAGQGEISSVRYDGKQLWVSTAKGGVFVVSQRGDILGQATSDKELPPHADRHIWPLEPGKCLVIGKGKGSEGAVWIASLSMQKSGQPDLLVEVIYAADERVPSDGKHGPASTKRSFNLRWVKEFKTEEGRPCLAVGTRIPPLRIDLPSLKISTLAEPLPDSENRGYSSKPVQKFARVRRGFLRIEYRTVDIAVATGDPDEPWKVQALFPATKMGLPKEQFIEYQGQLYCAGRGWRRIDPVTMEIESLTDPKLPPWFYFDRMATSAHYGLIAWREGKRPTEHPYRVIFSTEKLPRYHALVNIPKAARARHAGALSTLYERLIAAVPLRASGMRVMFWRKEQLRTPQLRALNDVYDLKELVFQQVPLTDKSLRIIKGLGVEQLVLYETEVTDAGLDTVATMKSLKEIWLEGSLNGREFTDAGLRKLQKLPIESVTLYGPGFTDKSVEILLKFPRLKKLNAFDTAISKKGIERLTVYGIDCSTPYGAYFPGDDKFHHKGP